MFITLLVVIIFVYIISKYFKNNKILLLNFIFYWIFILIYFLLKFIFLKSWFISENLRIDKSKAIAMWVIVFSWISLIYTLFLYKYKIKKYVFEQFLIIIYLAISLSLFMWMWIYSEFKYSNEYTMLLKVYSDFDISLFVIWIFIIYLWILYLLGSFINYIIYLKKNKPKINFSKQFFIKTFDKFAYLYRDIFVIGCFIVFSIIASDMTTLYSKYYNWYKNPDFFTDQTYICEDKTKLILEQKYRHHPIINPYNSFIDFYKQYWKKGPHGWYEINELHPDKMNQNYLQNCISQNGNNYFDEYERIHWKKPKDLLYKLQ